ncbi:hypothetical protein NB706_001075 [Xanthomonas sacchari]|nr:hypothetical protein [Xanthomonas sacchari]
MLPVPLLQQLADLAALQGFLAAAQRAGDQREGLCLRVGGDIVLAHVGQRPDHHVAAIVAAQHRRHRRQLGVEEQVHEERGDDVVAVVAQRDLGDAVLRRVAVQRAAAQPRTQRTQGLAFRHHPGDHRISVLFDHMPGHAALAQVGRQHVGGKARLLLVQVHRHQLERYRRLALQLQQDVQQGVAVLAAGQAHHDLVAGADHAEIGDGLADLPAQALAERRGVAGGGRCGIGERVQRRQGQGRGHRR